ncbi:endonuclease domain-containing protein [Prosthecobacter sp.]|uniref:endonuclease domain-containing protein n=1 Tax=Prosthecobacter sp. TaxID=1965333 RepID=UPI0037847C15
MPTRLEIIRHEITEERLPIIEFARKLRQDATDPEALVWGCLRGRRMNQRKFRRQHPVPPYVLDFYCADLKLAVELDGGQHNSDEGRQHDKARDAYLQSLGIETLRFTNDDVMRHTDSVMSVIWKKTVKHPPDSPSEA